MDAFGALSGRRTRGALRTPHLYRGEDVEKVEWEYGKADYFWEVLGDRVGIEVLNEKEVIDVGCGWGGKVIRYAEATTAKSFAGFDLPGVFDPEVPARYARERGLTNCSFTMGYAENIPYPSDRFDVAIVEDVLEHVEDPERTVMECWRVLRPGGLMVARFPSIRMMGAHHFDRALVYPGLHYVLPMRTWAAGLNYRLLHSDGRLRYEPFSEVVPTRYHKGVTRNLNGLDLASFKRIVALSGFKVRALDLVGYPTTKFRQRLGKAGGPLSSLYEALRSRDRLRELLSMSIVFVGEK